MERRMKLTAFDQYTEAYDMSNVKIKLKYDHTLRVAEISEKIAKSLGLSDEDIELAWEIGLLHDIGRFEQLRRFNTFKDADSIDHAEFGADLLFGENLIAEFDDEIENNPERRLIVEKAVRYHSRYRLPEDLNERESMFCKIILDADKVDIIRVNVELGLEDIYDVTTEEMLNAPMSEDVFATLMEGRTVSKEVRRTVVDHLAGHIALAFELEFPESRRILREQGYYSKILAFESKNDGTIKKMRAIREKAEKVLTGEE